MALMGPDELNYLEEEARTLQHNVRGWLLRRNYSRVREATITLQTAVRRMQRKQSPSLRPALQLKLSPSSSLALAPLSEERAVERLQGATRTMLARKDFLQTRLATTTLQAATRGMLARRNFRLMKRHLIASLVLQRNVRSWLKNQTTLDYDQLLLMQQDPELEQQQEPEDQQQQQQQRLLYRQFDDYIQQQ